MMQFKPVILSVCVCMLLVGGVVHAQQPALWAPVYPGAVQCEYSSRENLSIFLSRDSFVELEAFYSADRGIKPAKRDREGGGSALFIYRKSVPGDASSIDGVAISYNRTHGSSAAAVLRRLEQLILDGALDRQEFAEIRRRHESMGRYFQLSDQRDKRGDYMPMDELLFLQYEQQIEDYVQAGESWEKNEDDLMTRFNTLIAQGKFQEAAELMEKGSLQSIEAGRRPADRRVVELWKECLSEMASAAYPARIEIGRKR